MSDPDIELLDPSRSPSASQASGLTLAAEDHQAAEAAVAAMG